MGCVPKKVMFNAAALCEAMRHDAKGYGFDVTVNRFSVRPLRRLRVTPSDSRRPAVARLERPA